MKRNLIIEEIIWLPGRRNQAASLSECSGCGMQEVPGILHINYRYRTDRGMRQGWRSAHGLSGIENLTQNLELLASRSGTSG